MPGSISTRICYCLRLIGARLPGDVPCSTLMSSLLGILRMELRALYRIGLYSHIDP